MYEVVVFEKFDKFLKSSFDTRFGVQAVYQFNNKYRVTVELKPFYGVETSKIGLWRVELLGRSGTKNANKTKKCQENEWLQNVFSIETDHDSEFFVWYLNEKDVEIILGEIMKIREPWRVKLKRIFK